MMQRHMPIGYKLVDGKIQFDRPKASVVRKIFQDYRDGISLRAIAKELMVMGFLNANNKPSWNHCSIGKIAAESAERCTVNTPNTVEKNRSDAYGNVRNIFIKTECVVAVVLSQMNR